MDIGAKERFRELFTERELYLIYEAFNAALITAYGNEATFVTAELLEHWLNESASENGEYVVADLLKKQADNL